MAVQRAKGLARRELLRLGLCGVAAAAFRDVRLPGAEPEWSVGYWSGAPDERVVPLRAAAPKPLVGPVRLQLWGSVDPEVRAQLSHCSLEVRNALDAPAFTAWSLPSNPEAGLPGAIQLSLGGTNPVIDVHWEPRGAAATRTTTRLFGDGLALREGAWFLALGLRGGPQWRRLRASRTDGVPASTRLSSPDAPLLAALPGAALFTLIVQPQQPRLEGDPCAGPHALGELS